MRVSVIIPCLNEASCLGETLEFLRSEDKSNSVEFLVVDGGSSDGSAKIAKSLGARVLNEKPGRSRQLNAGAAAASGDLLFFLHADTLPPKGAFEIIEKTFQDQKIEAASFSLSFKEPNISLKLIAIFSSLRGQLFRFSLGDQGLAIRKEYFQDLGGYPKIELLEDLVLTRKLSKSPGFLILKQKVKTSGRRIIETGIVKSCLRNQLILIGFGLGVSPAKLRKLYN